MKRFIKSKKGFALLAALVVAVAASVGAYAYFSSTGTGSGSATVGTSTAFTIPTGNDQGGPLYPGDLTAVASEDYHVHNPSTGNQNLNQVVISVANSNGSAWSVTGGGNPACTKGDFQLSLDNSTWAAAGASVTDTTIAANLAGGANSATHTVYVRMIDSGANQDNCKLATVPLYYSAS
jgi:hypothetical protein